MTAPKLPHLPCFRIGTPQSNTWNHKYDHGALLFHIWCKDDTGHILIHAMDDYMSLNLQGKDLIYL
jgi:hypothetical protein